MENYNVTDNTTMDTTPRAYFVPLRAYFVGVQSAFNNETTISELEDVMYDPFFVNWLYRYYNGTYTSRKKDIAQFLKQENVQHNFKLTFELLENLSDKKLKMTDDILHNQLLPIWA